MKTVSFTKIEWMMLEELAKKSRQKPQDFLKVLIQDQYGKGK